MQTRNIYMKVLVAALCLVLALPVFAANGKSEVYIDNVAYKRNGSDMKVSMDMILSNLKVKSAGATVLVPMIVNGSDTLSLPSIGVYGRTSWFASRRNNRLIQGEEDQVMRYRKNMETIHYDKTIPYEPWMNGSDLVVTQYDYGCAGCTDAMGSAEIATYKNVVYKPTLIYQAVVADEVKTRELSGRAFVDFPVNLTEIYPDYRNNKFELQKIIATIDSVRSDNDVTITAISIKGFASPEGPYSNNVRLAKGRTAALTEYVRSLYKFPNGFIQTSYEPEDWEGLREYVVSHPELPNRMGILEIIDSDLQPDPKNSKIEKTYPEEYNFLWKNVYPALRHSDYRIEYNIRSYSDPVEILQVLRTQPQKLSLGEIYRATQVLEPGSNDYNEVFETAVRLFPNEPAANLNAANAALQRGDLIGAERYLVKAGNSAEATYARGVLAAMKGDYKNGIELINKAVKQGLKLDQEVLDHVKEAAKYAN